ncbi:PREDICTED: disease resistance protein TAO1-like [Ipomoea nil]|uniref:disease resistance protein TAO1-like n=1 Tax=Ipomoea nil TaxID=35883 RepID=UPI000900BD34|nr:PREDICTED: disease resistance protein TAO1-like [Ipomoea nil]
MLNQLVVLPIFYHVDPSQVRKQTGDFGYAFTQHRERFGADRVGAWKAALTKIAGFIGWHLKEVGDRSESDYINEVVEVVQQELNHTYLDVARHPVGIDARVAEIHALLQSGGKDDVRIIGIYGMGGVGKTTLAKALFNKIYRMFQGCSFLADVRSKGLDRLQEKLLRETLSTKKFEVDNVHRGISLVKQRLGFKKLLVVVDDVNHLSQLEALVREPNWFGPGSVIIITTRDVHLLNCLGIEEMYEVKRLSTWESLQVFSLHAFGNPVPLAAYAELTDMIVSYSLGLPLALTVLGSHFRGRKSIQEWQDDFKKLSRIPHDDILKILKISYDALDDDTQNIFLDIACFLIVGFSKETAVALLNGSGFCAESGIRILIDKCLLAEDLSMHALVRDMGREIVRKESPTQPGKKSRLIFTDDVCDVLKDNKGTEAIETMIIDLPENVILDAEVFSKMTRLRLLKILSMNVRGSLKYLSKDLRLLYWENCPLRCISFDLCLTKLVILKIKGGNIEKFQPNLQDFGCLEVLELVGCKKLKRAPNFTGARNLKTLSLYGCPLLEIVQDLPLSLVKLSTRYCPLLENVQDLSGLLELHELYLYECSNLIELRGVESLVNLERIDINGCSTLSSKSWCVKLFKALLQNPNHQQFRMWVSNDMVSKDLCSNEVVGVGCSSNYSLPLFLKKKGIFVGVNVYGRIDSQHEMNGRTELIAPHNDVSLECRVYDLLTEPNKFREVEELIEFYSSPVKTRELNSLLQTYVAYEEDDDGGVYFIPINPKVVMKFEAECRDGESREQQNEEGSSSSIWDVVFGCVGFCDTHN